MPIIWDDTNRRRCLGCGERMIFWRRRWAHRRCALTLGRARDGVTLSTTGA